MNAKSATFWEKFYSREILAPEADILCKWRECYIPGQNKGTYSQGRGYTSYHDKPRPVCVTRMCHGCPTGPIDSENRSMRLEPDWSVILSDLSQRSKIGTKRQKDKAVEELLSVSNWMIKYLNAYKSYVVSYRVESL